MRSSLILIILQSSCLTILVAAAMAAAQPVSLSKPNCPQTCGNGSTIIIPYPFGIGSGCSAAADFTVVCNRTTNPPTPYLEKLKLEILQFSLDRKYVRVRQNVFPLACNSTRKVILVGEILSSPFRYSSLYNSLVVVGCKNEVVLLDYDDPAKTTFGGCSPICRDDGIPSCTGTNCCQTSIPSKYLEPEIFYTTEPSRTPSVCGYAFISDRKWLVRDYSTFFTNITRYPDPVDVSFGPVPMILEWEFSVTKEDLKWPVNCVNESVPLSPSLEDVGGDSVNITRCYCEPGFEGNPYLPGGGCQDIDECSNSSSSTMNTTLNRCANIIGSTCINTMGSFTCKISEEKNQMRATIIGISSATGAVLLLGGAWIFAKVIRKRIKTNRKKRFFKRNGGVLLQQQVSSDSGGVDKVKLFTSKELSLATDRYNDNRILGHGGQGTVYKGMLPDGKIVAVKKSKKVDEADLDVFVNEVVILSQINHRNIVKLLGCCLETEVPLLVYEYVPNGTLFQHVHDQNDEEFPLSWKMRLRIGTEVAGALSYLHYAASVPIYHRDIKSTNILLDDKYRAKVSDFGTSRSIAIDQTHLTTRVLGTFGYLDPEYFQSSQFTEKSDVYSFGVVMVELLTGEKAISVTRDESGRSLATHFLHSMEEDRLLEIVDPEVRKEGSSEEIVAVAKLARRCLNLNGKMRPTMKEVAAELEGIQMMKEGCVIHESSKNEEFEFHSIEVYEDYDFQSTSDTINSMNVVTTESSKSPLLFPNS